MTTSEVTPSSEQVRRASPGPPTMLSHVAYITHDTGATVRFYTELLGMELVNAVLDDSIPSTGDPVRVTANGKVVSAGWSGGYGRMIEVDHGNGLATRYGHLSEINVKVGEIVKIGQVVGLVGSTGRSTGPHLHYETRIDGEAVDPQKFLRAGVRLSAG